MKHSVVTPPTQEPVSLAEFKAHARIDTADGDGLLAGYIIAARQWAEGVCALAFLTQTLDAYFDAFDGCSLELPRGPAQSVTSVTYLDSAGASQTLSTSYYYLNNRDRVNSLELADGYSWPSTYYRSNAVTVRYVAGVAALGDVPEETRHAILFYARWLYDRNDADLKAAEALINSKRVWY
jgi:uncharacterized phiE125 gp8 family phage protein